MKNMIAMIDSAPRESVSETNSQLYVDVQHALDGLELAEGEEPPSDSILASCANAAYTSQSERTLQPTSEVTIRLVGVAEMTGLNRDYRQQDKATNVLSFPFEPFLFKADGDSGYLTDNEQPESELNILGDIVICHAVILEEAREQQKTLMAHYAHMVIHGVLHLCGFDHQDDVTAKQMESLEIQILAQLAIANPYNVAPSR